MKYVFLLIQIVFIIPLYSQAPTQQWLNRYNGDGDFSDKYNCVLTDNNGNVYLGGYTVNANQRKDYLLVKYTNSGTIGWVVTYNGSDDKDDEILAMALGLNNQIIVTGYAKGNNTDDDIVTISYDQNGQVIWTAVYDNLLFSQDDQGNDIAVDGNGNVIIAGQTETPNDDYLILSYSASGTLNWSALYDGIGMSKDRALKVKIGSENSVYITGRSSNLIDDDIVTRKYSNLGTLLWTRTFNNGWDDRPTDFKVDASDNVYVCGFSNNGSNDDMLVLKYSSAGIDEWSGGFIFNGPNSQNERAISMVADLSGNIYLTGKCDNDPTLNQNFDYKTLKISPTKNILWQADHNGTGNGDDEPTSIGLLPSGNVVVTGKSDSDINASISNFDIKTICYSASTGNQSWIKTYSSASGKDDIGNQLAIDNAGNILVGGSSQDIISESDALAIKYSSSGVENWSKLFVGIGDNTENVNAMALDALGNTYLAGYTYSRSNLKDLCVIKLNPFGDTLWVKKYNGSDNGNDEATDIKVDASGNVYVTGFIKDSLTDFDFITIKMNTTGNVLWVSQYNNNSVNGEDKGTKLEIDAGGNVYVLGYTDRNPLFLMNEDIILLKYSSGGVQQWVKQYNGIANLADIPIDLCYLPSGKIVLTGSTENSSDDDIVTIAYNTSGTQLWMKTFSGSGGGKDKPIEMDFDNAENIYIAGRTSNGSNNDALVIKYSSTGTQVWANTFNNNSNDDRSSCIDVNSVGTVYVSGTTDDGVQRSIFTRSLSSSGAVNWTINYDHGLFLNDESFDLKIDNNGDILVVGYAEVNGATAPHRNFLILKYSSGGNLWWSKIYDNGINENDEINVCELDASNNIYISGQSISSQGQKDIVTIKYNSPLKLKELSENLIIIYPNPFTDFTEMKIDHENTSDISIILIDLLGNQIRSEKLMDGKIKRGNLKSGMYILKVFNTNGILGISNIIIQD
jgi:uncharacterized delta-60 repeat protein